MNSTKKSILTINGGSSSIKFALFQWDKSLEQIMSGKIDRIGAVDSIFSFAKNTEKESKLISISDFKDATIFLCDWLEKQTEIGSIVAIGHRIVHGMNHSLPEIITPELINELKQITDYDPEHLPNEISLIEFFQNKFPRCKQIACFDTAFHISMPLVAKQLAIPRKYYKQGIHRYGFHGLSYAYLMEELKNVAGKETAQGKIILAHLGNGASLAAVKEGKCIDTSMGLTPSSGLVMGTRSGDLDPGVVWQLLSVEKKTISDFNHIINHESGLIGISETTADMRELLKSEGTDHRAAEAINLFCYQTRKWIGAYSAALGGIDTLVFSGGIGENQSAIRGRICNGLAFLGIELDNNLNNNHEAVISSSSSKVSVRVIKTNEELMIARSVCDLMNY